MKNVIWLIMMMFLCSCEKIDLNENKSNKEQIEQLTTQEYSSKDTIIYKDDSMWIMMNTKEYTDILINLSPEQYEVNDYHIPTYEEAKLIKQVQYTTHTNQRLLCKKNDVYYTYLFNNEGSVSKAGTKTKYSILLIKVFNNNTQFEITI